MRNQTTTHPAQPLSFRFFPQLRGIKGGVFAFTLVELVVVITILAILGTIAFLSFQGYSTSARNSTRVSDLSRIKSSLGLYVLKVGKFPDPTGGVPITYSGGTVWTQGTIGDSVIKNLSNLNKTPKDPLVGNEYTYSTTNTKGEYELGTIEETGYGYNENKIIPNSYAAKKNALAMVIGNYNGQILKVNTGSVDYILAVPSIINTDISDKDLISIINKRQLSYNHYGNLPGSYNDKGYTMTGSFNYGPTDIVVFAGNISNLVNSGALQQTMINSLQTTYDGTQLSTEQNIAGLLAISTAVDKENLVRSMVNNKVGGLVSNVGVLPSITSTSYTVPTPVSGPCTGLPVNALYYGSGTSYSLVNATAGTTLDAITAGYSSNPTSNTCQYKCTSNTSWTGISCATNANPTNLSLSHTTRNKTFTFSWTAGVGNGGSCKLQYYKNGTTWTDISATTYNCDTTLSGQSVTLPGDGWNSAWSSISVRAIRTSDSAIMGTFAQNLTCTPTSSSASITPSIDEDCNGSWDNTSSTNVSGCGGPQCVNYRLYSTAGCTVIHVNQFRCYYTHNTNQLCTYVSPGGPSGNLWGWEIPTSDSNCTRSVTSYN